MRRGVGGRVRRLKMAAWPAVFVFLASCAKNAPQDALDPEGPIARTQHNLFMPIFWVATGVFMLVQGLVIATVIRHRHRPGRPDPVQVHGKSKLEIGWTALPAVILLGVASPIINTIFELSRQPNGTPLQAEV